MAKFTYNPNDTMTTTKEDSQNYPKVEFLSRYLKNDGDSVIVRFPYASINDFDVYHCHRVQLPGYQYAQNVMCARVDLKKEPASVCPICSSGDQVNSRVNDRFIVKAVADRKSVV